MPAKAKAAAPAKTNDGPDVSLQQRRIKTEVTKAVTELAIPPQLEVEKIFMTKLSDALSSGAVKLIFTGERPGVLGVQALSMVLREITPSVLNVKTLCFWRTPVGDDGLRAISQALLPKPPSEAQSWPGFVNLELLDVQISPAGCEPLGQALQANVPLKTLVLDLNPIGDRGATLLAEGLQFNRELQVLSMGYCQIGPAGGAALGSLVIPNAGGVRVLVYVRGCSRACVRVLVFERPLRTVAGAQRARRSLAHYSAPSRGSRLQPTLQLSGKGEMPSLAQMMLTHDGSARARTSLCDSGLQLVLQACASGSRLSLALQPTVAAAEGGGT